MFGVRSAEQRPSILAKYPCCFSFASTRIIVKHFELSIPGSDLGPRYVYPILIRTQYLLPPYSIHSDGSTWTSTSCHSASLKHSVYHLKVDYWYPSARRYPGMQVRTRWCYVSISMHPGPLSASISTDIGYSEWVFGAAPMPYGTRQWLESLVRVAYHKYLHYQRTRPSYILGIFMPRNRREHTIFNMQA